MKRDITNLNSSFEGLLKKKLEEKDLELIYDSVLNE